MTFKYGVFVNDTTDPSSPNVNLSANAIPFIMGCAYGTDGTGDAPITLQKITGFDNYKTIMGFGGTSDDEPDTDYTLESYAYLFFRKFKNAPVYMLNVYVAATHPGGVGDVDATDFTAVVDTVDEIFPTSGVVPCHQLCPGYSEDGTLQTAMEGKIDYQGSHFKVPCIFDGAEADDVAATVVTAGLITTDNVMFTYPKYGGFDLSMLQSCVAVMATRENDDIPYRSPSNYTSPDLGHALPINLASTDKVLGVDDSDSLNEAGVITWTSFGVGGKVLWGSFMVSFVSSVSDYLNDTYIPRMMANYLRTLVTLNIWENVDNPTNLVLIQSVVAKLNAIGGAMQAKGAILGFNIEFKEADNLIVDLQAGILHFTMTYLAPKEAIDIEIDLEINLNYLNSLFA